MKEFHKYNKLCLVILMGIMVFSLTLYSMSATAPTISIITTDVDPAVKDGSPAAISRSYGSAARQIYSRSLSSGAASSKPPRGSYNAEFVKQLSPAMADRLKALGTRIGK